MTLVKAGPQLTDPLHPSLLLLSGLLTFVILLYSVHTSSLCTGTAVISTQQVPILSVIVEDHCCTGCFICPVQPCLAPTISEVLNEALCCTCQLC